MFEGISGLDNQTLGKVDFQWAETVQINRELLEEGHEEEFMEWVENVRVLSSAFPPAPAGWNWELRNRVIPLVLRFSYAPTIQVELRWKLVPIPEYVVPLPAPEVTL